MISSENPLIISQPTSAYNPDALKKRLQFLRLLTRLQLKDTSSTTQIAVEEGLEGFGTIQCKTGICTACGKCVNVCPTHALECVRIYDLAGASNIQIQPDQRTTNRVQLAFTIQHLMKKPATTEIPVPPAIQGYGHMIYHPHRCIGCKDCVDACPEKILSFTPMYNLGEVVSQYKMEADSE